ncbi:MAG: efflux RND transporter periplasmic adaptor subunit [Oligosphaeraceae bacterium]
MLSSHGVYGQDMGAGPGLASVEVPVCEVQEREERVSRRVAGQLLSRETVEIVPRVGGELLEVCFQEGGEVSQGQVLYRIDDVPYQAAVKRCQAQVQECQAKLAYSEKTLSRTQTLHGKEVATLDELENAESDQAALAAQLLAAEAQLILAEEDLRHCVITSPIAGRISPTAVTRGNVVSADNTLLATVFQTDPLRLRFSMSAKDFLGLGGGMDALNAKWSCRLVLADGSSYPLEGRWEMIHYQANRNTDTVQLYALFDNPDLTLIPNTTVTVRLGCATGRRLAAIPQTALLYDQEGAYVWLVGQEGKAERRRVEPGTTEGEWQLILKGVSPGESVVADGTHKVMDGVAVQPAGRK